MKTILITQLNCLVSAVQEKRSGAINQVSFTESAVCHNQRANNLDNLLARNWKKKWVHLGIVVSFVNFTSDLCKTLICAFLCSDGDSQSSWRSTIERNSLSGEPESGSIMAEVFISPEPLKSPVITVTPENGCPVQYSSPQESPGGTPKVDRKEALKSVKRSDSITRQKTYNRKYELSPELLDKSVRFLERQYGGKEKAHQAARIIQSEYRKYRMDEQFKRMRTYSCTPVSDLFRKKSNNDLQSPVKTLSPQPQYQNAESQVTPILRIKKKKGGDQRVKSILIIDNINSVTGGEPQMYTSENLPTDLTSIFTPLRNEDSENVQKEVEHEKEDFRLASVTSETEHYVKVEIVDNAETFEEEKTSSKVPNGDLSRRQQKGTLVEDVSVNGSDDSGIMNIILTVMFFIGFEILNLSLQNL